MELLDLPEDLLHKILYQAILARHVKRGLRLRLVCTPLFQSRLLDIFCSHGVGNEWYLKNQHGAEQFWHSYITYRVRNDTDNTVARFMEIRQVARLICEESGNDIFSTIDTLCWLALEKTANAPVRSKYSEGDFKTPNLRLNLLSAAAHFNLISLVNQLLLDGLCPTSHDNLFPPPMEVAARAGNTEMIELFQQKLPEFEKLKYGGWKWLWKWHGKVAPDAIIGAVIRGDMTILNLALYPPSRATPHSTHILGQPFGNIDPCSPIGEVLKTILQQHTRSPEIFEYLTGLLGSQSVDLPHLLVLHAGLGNMSMVRYLLGLGVPVDSSGQAGQGMHAGTALAAACDGCHEKIVDFLLEHNADPNVGAEDGFWVTALSLAASTGSLVIVRKLLRHGAYVNEAVEFFSSYRRPAIWWAVALEHTAMFQLLLENGASLEGRIGTVALELSFALGMDPMAEILQGLEIQIIEPIVNSAGLPWEMWAYYPGVFTIKKRSLSFSSE